MIIDIEKLREDLLNDAYGAFFGGGFGGAMIEAADIENASPEKAGRAGKEKGNQS